VDFQNRGDESNEETNLDPRTMRTEIHTRKSAWYGGIYHPYHRNKQHITSTLKEEFRMNNDGFSMESLDDESVPNTWNTEIRAEIECLREELRDAKKTRKRAKKKGHKGKKLRKAKRKVERLEKKIKKMKSLLRAEKKQKAAQSSFLVETIVRSIPKALDFGTAWCNSRATRHMRPLPVRDRYFYDLPLKDSAWHMRPLPVRDRILALPGGSNNDND
jgi:hypothetical protein